MFLDNVLIACHCFRVLARVKKEFKSQCTVTGMCEAKEFLENRGSGNIGLNYLSRFPHLCLQYTCGTVNWYAMLTRIGEHACLPQGLCVGMWCLWHGALPPGCPSAIVTMTSPMKSEYVACYHAAQKVAWKRTELQEIDLEPAVPTTIYIDNTSAHSWQAIQTFIQGPSLFISISLTLDF